MASRQALHSRRQRRGIAVFDVVADEVALIEWLISIGYLAQKDADDRKAVERAIAERCGGSIEVDA